MQKEPNPTLLVSLTSDHLSLLVQGLYLAVAFFPVLYINGEHQLDETY